MNKASFQNEYNHPKLSVIMDNVKSVFGDHCETSMFENAILMHGSAKDKAEQMIESYFFSVNESNFHWMSDTVCVVEKVPHRPNWDSAVEYRKVMIVDAGDDSHTAVYIEDDF